NLNIVHLVVRIPPLAFSFDRLAPFEHCHVAGHRFVAHDVIGPEFVTGGVEFALRAHVGESLRELLRVHDIASFLKHTLLIELLVVTSQSPGWRVRFPSPGHMSWPTECQYARKGLLKKNLQKADSTPCLYKSRRIPPSCQICCCR